MYLPWTSVRFTAATTRAANLLVAVGRRDIVDRQRRAQPAAQARPVIGQPKPIFSSTSGLMETELPASAVR
jgi:hypothetical protein